MKKLLGFTLIEILIAVAIIGILTAIGIVSYSSVNRRARDAKRTGDIEQIRSALEMYRSDNGFYPPVNPTFDFASHLTDDAVFVLNKYIPAIPTDPQGATHNYYYEATDYDSISTHYYGYCVCSFLETQASKTSTCDNNDTTKLPSDCMYGVKNP